MINKIGSADMRVIHSNFRAANEKTKQQDLTKSKSEFDIQGLDILALYNSAVTDFPIKKDILEIPQISPVLNNQDDITKLDGERIYTSAGKLHSIIRRDENTVTIFTPDEQDENIFSLIEVYDKSNHLIKTQTREDYDGKTIVTIREYNPETGKQTGFTEYQNSEIYYTGKTDIGENITVNSEEYYPKNEYTVSIASDKDNTYANITLNKEKQVKEFYSNKEDDNISKSTTINFYNGIPYQISKSQVTNLPNIPNMDFLEDEDLKTADYFKKPENLKNIEGKKTYYSNGEMETNCYNSDEGQVTAHFLPDGTCDKIIFSDKELVFDKNNQTITEKNDIKTKTTSYTNDTLKKVRYENQNSYKEIWFYDNRKPFIYEEGVIKDKEEYDTKHYTFNKNGMLDWAIEDE